MEIRFPIRPIRTSRTIWGYEEGGKRSEISQERYNREELPVALYFDYGVRYPNYAVIHSPIISLHSATLNSGLVRRKGDRWLVLCYLQFWKETREGGCWNRKRMLRCWNGAFGERVILVIFKFLDINMCFFRGLFGAIKKENKSPPHQMSFAACLSTLQILATPDEKFRH